MKRILLTKNKYALVDDCDFLRVNQFNWCAMDAKGMFYAARQSSRKSRGGRKTILMHRFILGRNATGKEVGHLDGNGLNNRRKNLLPGTHTLNAQGVTRKARGTSSRFRGVSICRRTESWQVHICVNQNKIFLGRYVDEKTAAGVYNQAARSYFGPHAQQNKI